MVHWVASEMERIWPFLFLFKFCRADHQDNTARLATDRLYSSRIWPHGDSVDEPLLQIW